MSPATRQIIQLHANKFSLIMWDQTAGFVIQVYFTDTREYNDSPTTSEAALMSMGEWNMDSLCIVNITTAKQNLRNCVYIAWGILHKHPKVKSVSVTEKCMSFIYLRLAACVHHSSIIYCVVIEKYATKYGSSMFFGALVIGESTIGLSMAWCPCVVSSHGRHCILNHKQLDSLSISYVTRLSVSKTP